MMWPKKAREEAAKLEQEAANNPDVEVPFSSKQAIKAGQTLAFFQLEANCDMALKASISCAPLQNWLNAASAADKAVERLTSALRLGPEFSAATHDSNSIVSITN